MFKTQDSKYIYDIYQDLICEGRKDRYLMMFQFIPKTDDKAWVYVKKELQWALNILKTEDRVVWYLNQVKYIVLSMMALGESEGSKIRIMGQKLGRKLGYNFPDYRPPIQQDFHTDMEHYFTQGIPVLDNYRITDISKSALDVSNELYDLEQEYFKSAGDSIPMSDTDEIIMKFDDGSVWVNTHTPTCTREESKIMQHCGNEYTHQQSGDEIFSFRTPSSIKGRWNPHLTFVVNDGIIRESKGKQNEKPDVDKYGKYIFELLKSDYILGFEQYDTHAAQNNFYLDDLPAEWVDELRTIKDEDFFEGGEKEDLDKKAKELFETYQFNNLSVTYDVDDYDEPSIYANAYFEITIPIPENNDFDDIYWDDDIIKNLLNIDFKLKNDDISYDYNTENRNLEIRVGIKSYNQEYYNSPMENFEEFLDDCNRLDRSIPDAQSLYSELIENNIIISYFSKIFSTLTDEANYEIPNMEKNFSDLDFFDIEYDTSEPLGADFNGEINLGKIPMDIVDDDKVLGGMESWKKINVSHLPSDHPLKQLSGIIIDINEPSPIFIMFKIIGEYADLIISTQMRYDENHDDLETYQNEYLKVRKLDAYLNNNIENIQGFFQDIIIALFKSKVYLKPENITFTTKKEGMLGTTLRAKYGDKYLMSKLMYSDDNMDIEDHKEKLLQEILKKIPYIYANDEHINMFKKYLENPNIKPSYENPDQMRFKFENKIIRFKTLFYS